MPIEIGQALKLLGGAPHLKVGSFIAENLPIAKVLDGGPIGGLLSQVLQNGPSALMQNPIAAAAGQVQGAIGAAASALSSVSGAASLVSAITGASGLAGAVSRLSAAADLLSGVAMPPDGQFGLLDVVTHTSITDMLGASAPASMGLDQVLGPLNAGAALGGVASALPGVVSSVVSGTMSIAAATAWVSSQTYALTGVTSASNTALQSAQDAAHALVSVSSAAALLASPNAALQALVPMIVQPAFLPTMQDAVASHLDA